MQGWNAKWCASAFAAVWLIGFCAAPALAQGAAKPANVIIILADDMGWADNSIFKDMGGRFPTPNLERIAKTGVRFPNAYVTAPVCSPSRAGLMTGRYQNRFGFEFLLDPPRDDLMDNGLDLKELTLADVLKSDGYHTGLIGKWHLGVKPHYYPMKRGFDEFYGVLRGGTNYINTTLPEAVSIERGGAGALQSGARRNPGAPVVQGPNAEVVNNFDKYLTDDFTDQAVKYIDNNQQKPFFLYLAYNAPHTPFEVTQKYYDRFPDIKDKKTRIYAAMISALDDGVGRVLDTLEKDGLRDNTMVVFLSDNGCAMYTGVCTCEPLRGGKASQYEGGLRTPMAISWPAKLAKGQTYTQEVSALDLFPTIVKEAAGATLPADRAYDGVDLMPYLTGINNGNPHQVLYWWRDPYRSIRDGDWKLWISRTGPEHFLFNLVDDPNEKTNLYSKFPDKVAQLDKELTDWHADKLPARWTSSRAMNLTYCGVNLIMPG